MEEKRYEIQEVFDMYTRVYPKQYKLVGSETV